MYPVAPAIAMMGSAELLTWFFDVKHEPFDVLIVPPTNSMCGIAALKRKRHNFAQRWRIVA
jgi:hypothetical protein